MKMRKSIPALPVQDIQQSIDFYSGVNRNPLSHCLESTHTVVDLNQ
jgi:hypothetical protein